MNGSRTLAGLCIALLLATGCGTLKTRTPIPREYLHSVSLVGYDDVRYWGDEPSDALNSTFIESWQQERVALGLAPDQRLFPDAHYLAISGGGQNGAFGAGILTGWTAAGNRPTFKVVTGISTGALIAPFAFLGSDYDEQMREVYTGVDEKDIAIFQGLLALFRSDSAFDTTPLAKLAEKYFTEEMLDKIAEEHRKGRRLLIGTTHLDAGRPVIWDIGRIACSDRTDRVKLFHKVLLASAAIPAAFPPVYLEVVAPNGKKYDEMHVDGGVTREMFLLPSELHLYQLRDKAGVERQSHLYLIRNARYLPEYAAVPPRVGNIAARSVETLIKSQAAGDLLALYYESKENKMTYALTSIPDDFPDDSKTLFDRKYMTRLFDTGAELAKSGAAWRNKPTFDKTPATNPTTEPAPATSVGH